MDDRTMLELAAKAAGEPHGYKKPFDSSNYAKPGEFEGGWGMVLGIGMFWNPLTDDGDALRLAVQLGLRIEIDNNLSRTHCVEMYGAHWVTSPHNDDPYAATRRAITRAAAAIQLAKESGK